MPKTCPVCATTYPDADAFCPKDGSTLRRVDAATSLVGSVIADRYLVSRLLGEGGMGQVYLAGHVRLPQQAAIKVLHAGMVQDPGAIARFNREAANAARIEHERVARVFDFGETPDGQVYLAMEYVPGRTLRALLESEGRLSPARAAQLVHQVAEGLDAAHRLGIVHRDLKPDNVLVVTDESGVDRCKVVDFGIAKALHEGERPQTQLTQAGSIIGTPEYMSPEQVLGEAVDARSDVYALALLAFHLLTGSLPFTGGTPERLLTARLIDPPRTLREAAPDVAWPELLQQVFDRALSGEPAARTPSALAFADDLIAAIETWTGEVLLRGRTPISSATVAAGGAPTVTLAGRAAVERPPAPSGPLPGDTGADRAGASVSGGGRGRGSGARVIALALGALGLTAVGVVLLQGRGRDDPAEAGGQGAAPVAAAPVAAAPVTAPGGGVPATAAPGVGEPAGTAVAPRAGPASARETSAGATRTATVPGETAAAAVASAAGTTGTAGSTGSGETPTSGPDDGLAATRRTLDSLERAVAVPSEAIAREAIPRFGALLPRLTQPADSARVYAKLAILHGETDDQTAACVAFRAFRRLARTEGQLRLLQAMASVDFYARCP